MAQFCRPRWVKRFLLRASRADARLTTCVPEEGRAPCSPESLRAKAEKRASELLGRPIKVTNDAYALARYIASERGSGTPETKLLLAQLAIRQAQGREQSVYKLLACTNKWGACVYGPINVVVQEWDPETGVVGEKYTAPFGRWAATTKDPHLDDLLIAQFALAGGAPGFARGADDQDSPKIVGQRKILDKAAKHVYWVGQIPGVEAHEVFAWVPRPDVSPTGTQGKALIAAAETFVSQRRVSQIPGDMCSGGGFALIGVATVLIGLVGLLAYSYDRSPDLPGRGA